MGSATSNSSTTGEEYESRIWGYGYDEDYVGDQSLKKEPDSSKSIAIKKVIGIIKVTATRSM